MSRYDLKLFSCIKVFDGKFSKFIIYCSFIYIHDSFSVVIIQKNKKDYALDFDRNWDDYKRGFGSVNEKTFWIGLDVVHQLTKTGSYYLEVVIKKSGETKILKWLSFMVGNESEKYKLSISGFDAGSSGLPDYIQSPWPSYDPNGMYFTTRDRDNDQYESNCASTDMYWGGKGSGWWYGKSCSVATFNRADGPYYYPYPYDESMMILKRYQIVPIPPFPFLMFPYQINFGTI